MAHPVSVASLKIGDVQGAEIAVVNTHGDVFTIRKFRRSRGDYYVVRHTESGQSERFSKLEKATQFMSEKRG